MLRGSTEWWDRLAQWSPAAFVTGGIGLLGISVVGALDVAAVVSTPAWVHATLMLGGVWFTFVGLLGFYPYVADHAPRLSGGGVFTSGLGGIALTVGIAGSIVVALTTGTRFGDGPSWGPPLLAGAFVLALLSFLCYGAASVRTERPSRTVGLLLFVPLVAFLGQAVLLVSKIVTDSVLAGAQLALAGVAAIAVLAIGYLLRTGDTTIGSGEPASTGVSPD